MSAHAEEPTGRPGDGLHGVQLWVAQPEATRHGGPAFEHHPVLPQVELGPARATVLVGEFGGAASPARRDTDLIGVDLQLVGGAAGAAVGVDVRVRRWWCWRVASSLRAGPSRRASSPTSAPGRDELGLVGPRGPPVLLLLGGKPFESPVSMWWNFVGRSMKSWPRPGASGTPVGAVRHDRLVDGRIPAPPTPWSEPRE